MSHILVVDDDERLLRLLARYLEKEGYVVSIAADAREARARAAADRPHLIILDLGLPGEDGLVLIREIRSQSTTPIIILTGKTSTLDKVVGLEVGADDYVTKPFDERELLARVRSVLRRFSARADPAAATDPGRVARFGGWVLDLAGHELTSPDGERVHLTSHEFLMLETFVAHPNRALGRDSLMELLSGRDWNPLDRSIDVLIAKLRKKIEKNPRDPELIKTIRSTGYKFVAKVTFD